MKKIVQKLFGAAVALGLVSAAHAANPVAVWDGFASLASGDYTWTKSEGTTISEGVVTIGSDGGLTLPISSGSIYAGRTLTIVVDAEVPSFGSAETPLIDFYVNANCVTLTGDGSTLRQRWNYGGSYGSSAWTPGRQKIAVVFKGVSGASDRGTAAYVDGVSKIALVNSLMSGNGNLTKISIGCYAKDAAKVAANMKVYRVALFDSNISAADVAAYRFPSEISEYAATIDAGKKFSEVVWTPAKTRPFCPSDTLTVTVSDDATLTFDEDAPVAKLTVVSAAGADLTLDKGDDVTLTLPVYDFSGAAGRTTLAFDPVAASVIAGADTVLDAVSAAALTIAAGKKLTVKSGSLTASKVSNGGTLNFEGGTAENPIALAGDTDFGPVTLAANTYVKNVVTGNRSHKVTGTDLTSCYAIGKATGEPGMGSANALANLTLVTDTASGLRTWVERVTITDESNVALAPKTTMYLSASGLVARSLKGAGSVTGNALTVNCSEAADYAGASSVDFTVGGTETQTLSGDYTGALTVNAGATVRLTGRANPSRVTNAGTVVFDYGPGTTNVVRASKFANAGMIRAASGVVVVQDGVTGSADATGSGAILTGYAVGINDCGRFAIPAGQTAEEIVLFDGAGNVVPITGGDANYVSFDWQIAGGVCWWDYEFDNSLANTGSDGTALTWDGGSKFAASAAYLTNVVERGAVATTNVGIRVPCRPYRHVSSWPAEATFVMYGKVPSEDNTVVIGFGSQTYPQGDDAVNGPKRNTIFLAVGDASEGEVKLCKVNAFSAATELCTMKVANATTTDHLYAFVLKTVDGNTVVNTYLDGQLLQPYAFDGTVTLGGGFQLGSIHGGTNNSGYTAPTANSAVSEMDFLRVYEEELGSAALARYAELYPYESPNGVYSRDLDGADGAWVEAGKWTDESAAASVAEPAAGAVVNVEASASTELNVNLAADTTYEAMRISGAGTVTIRDDDGETSGKINLAGRLAVNADTVLDARAIRCMGAPISVADGKRLAFDMTSVDLANVFETTVYDLTGVVTLGEGAAIVALYPTNAVPGGRTVTFAADPKDSHWKFTVTCSGEIAGTVNRSGAWDADGVITWRMGDAEIAEPDWTKLSSPAKLAVAAGGDWEISYPSKTVPTAIVKDGPGALAIVRGNDGRSYTVEAGTLKFANMKDKGGATITVNANGVFDLNGGSGADPSLAVTLNGGKLVNDGTADMGVGKRQFSAITLTADSSVGGTKALYFVSSGYAANSLELGGFTLRKVDANTFGLCNTTVKNGTLFVEEGALDLAKTASTFNDDATLAVGANGTLQTSVSTTFADPAKWSTVTGAVVVAGGTLQLGDNNCQVWPETYAFGESIAVASGATLTLKLGTQGNYSKPETVFYDFATDVVLNGGTLNSPDGGYRFAKVTVNADSLFAPRWDKHHFITELSGGAMLTLDANHESLFVIEGGDFTGTVKANTGNVHLRPEGTALADATVLLAAGGMNLQGDATVGTLVSAACPVSGTGTLTLGDGSTVGGGLGGGLSLVVEGGVTLSGVNAYTGTTLIRNGATLDAQLGVGLPASSTVTVEAGGSLVVDLENFSALGVTTEAYRFAGDLQADALEIVNAGKYPWLSVGIAGDDLGKVLVDVTKMPLKGLHIVKLLPKHTTRPADRDPNGRDSGWIDLVNFGPDPVDLANYKIVRSNLGKKAKSADADFGRLCAKTVAAGETFRVYTSEEYETAEDYGGDGKTVAWFKTAGGVVTKLDDFEDGAIMVVPAKVNPKKYPMVRLYDFTAGGNGTVVDEVIVPCDLDDNLAVELVANTNKLERYVVYTDGTKATYGPEVAPLYGVKDTVGDLALMKPSGFAPANAAYPVVLPVNPFMTDGRVLASNEIESVRLVYRVFDPSGEMQELEADTVGRVVEKGDADEATYGKGCRLWSGEIPAEAMATPGALVQFRAKITDRSGAVWYAPRNLNPDIGYAWYGVVVEPAIADAPSTDLESAAVCTNRLQTFLLFVTDADKAQMDRDVDSQTLANKARLAVYDTQTHTYYDNVRIDLRGQTSASFHKKSHGLRFSKVAPLVCRNPFDGTKIETRKTSFVAEYGDPTYLRQTLALKAMRESGVKAPFEYPVRLYLNGRYYQLAFHSNRFTDELVEDWYKLEAKAGHAYKNVHQLTTGTGAEKKTPDDDNESDLSVLRAYETRFNTTDQAALAKVAMTNFNVAAWVNYLAATRVTQECDDIWTNMGIYINTFDAFYNPDGDDLMMPLAYDQNLSWGQWYYADSPGYGRMGIVATNDLMKSHPFYGGREILFHHPNGTTLGNFNRGVEVILKQEAFRNMLARRIRTLAEQYLGALDAEKADTPVWQWAMAFKAAIADDVAVDHAKWDYANILSRGVSNIWVWPTALGFEEAFDDLWENYFVPRRRHLYDTHAAKNAGKEGYPGAVGYATAASAGIPETQPSALELKAAIAVAGLGPDELVITNGNAVAVDMSGWTLRGDVDFSLPAGTVVGAESRLSVVRDRRAYLASLGGDFTPRIVVGNATFAEAPETIVLTAADGTKVIAPPEANPQQTLRICEIYGSTRLGEGDFGEFVVVTNLSDRTVSLAGLKFKSENMKKGTVTLDISLAEGEVAPYGTYRLEQATLWPDAKISNGKIRETLTDSSGEVVQTAETEFADNADQKGASMLADHFGNPCNDWHVGPIHDGSEPPGPDEPDEPVEGVFISGAFAEPYVISTPGSYVLSNATLSAGISVTTTEPVTLHLFAATASTATSLVSSAPLTVEGSGELTLSGAGTVATFAGLTVNAGTLNIASSTTDGKTLSACVMKGSYVQNGGTVRVGISATGQAADEKSAYAFHWKKQPGCVAQIKGGVFDATMSSDCQSVVFKMNDGSNDVLFGDATVTGAFAGCDGRMVSTDGKLDVKSGAKVSVTSTATGSRVFKAAKTIKLRKANVSVTASGAGSEIFSSDDAIDAGHDEMVLFLASDDDCFSAQTNITVSGGVIQAVSTAGDALDSNGDMLISGGQVFAFTCAADHEALDVQPAVDNGLTHTLEIRKEATVLAIGGKQTTPSLTTGSTATTYTQAGVTAKNKYIGFTTVVDDTTALTRTTRAYAVSWEDKHAETFTVLVAGEGLADVKVDVKNPGKDNPEYVAIEGLEKVSVKTTVEAISAAPELAPGDEGVELAATDAESAAAEVAGYVIALSAEDEAAGVTTDLLKIVAVPVTNEFEVVTFQAQVAVNPETVAAPAVLTEATGEVEPMTIGEETEDGREVSVGIDNAVPGLWYGYEVADKLGTGFANDVKSFERAKDTTVTIKGSPRKATSGFFRVKVLPAKPTK